MARRRIEGTRHVKRKLKIGTRIGIGALAIALISASTVFVASKLGKLDSDKYSIETVVSRIESAFKGAAPVGSVVAINTSATTNPDGTPMGYVSGGGTLINRSTTGNTLTLTASGAGDNVFGGWTVNGSRVGTMSTTLNVCINTSVHDKEYYDSTTETLYVTDTSNIQAVYRAALKAPVNEQARVGLYITPNTGHCWIDNIDGHPETWDGYLIIPGGHGGASGRLILQYVDGDSARAYVYDSSMRQISTGTGHRSDSKDLYVDFTIPDVDKWTTIYCVPRLNQTDNSCFVIFESNPADAGSCGGTMTSGNSPFTTQLQATPNKGYRLKDWTVVFDGDEKTLTDKNPSVYINGTYKIIANFEEAYYNVTLEKTEPSDGGSVTGLDKYKEGSSPNISITCNDGYDLDNWSYTTKDGIVHSGTSENFTIPNITEDIALYVTFKSNKKKVEVRRSPEDGGTVTIKKDSGTEKNDYEEFVDSEKAILSATPANGYEFLYWKNTTDPSNEETTNPYEYSVNSAETWTAYFAKKALNIKTDVYPNGVGNVSIDYTDANDNPKHSDTLGDHSNVKLKSSITLKAPLTYSNYRFSRFVDSNNNIIDSGNNTATVSGITKDETYTAIYVPNTAKITLKSEPQIVGSTFGLLVNGNPSSTPEEAVVNYGDTLKITASAPSHICRYWKDQNGVEYPNDFTTPAKYGDQTFTAYFVKMAVDLSVDISPSGVGAGTFELVGDGTPYSEKHVYNNLTALGNYTLKATPKPGYAFDKFVDVKTGETIPANASNEITINSLDEDRTIMVYFTKQLFTASVAIKGGGSATINGKYGSDKVNPGDSVELIATPTYGYLFKGWYENPDGSGELSKSMTYTYTPISGDKTFYAVFEQAQVNVTLDISLAGYGSVKLYGNDPITAAKTYQVPGSSTITMEAYPISGKKFMCWAEDIEGVSSNQYTNNPLTITDVNKNVRYLAIFEDAKSTITVNSNPSNGSGGTATVSSGTRRDQSSLDINNGEAALLRATPADGYTFLYWTDSSGTQYEGRRGLDGGSTLTIEQVYKSDTYTAHFVKKDLTILLEATPAGAGMVRLDNNPFESDRVQYHVRGNSSIEISAEPKDPKKYKFERWENKTDSSKVYTTNPLTIVSATEPMHYVAVFTPLTIGVKVVASPASGGKVTKTINDDGSVTISAIPNRGYTFANWKKGDKLLTMGVKYTIKAEDVKDGDVYTAYFKLNKDYDARTDITKENFYREWRKVYDPSYTVTRETMKQQAHATIVGLRQYDDATPPLKNFAAFGQARAYYESLLEESDIKRLKGIFGDSELITVEGEILNPDLLPDFEVYENKAEDFTLKKFGDKYDTEILTVKRIYEPEQFNNIKRTYLWRYTGAQFKDNIYLLYDINGDKEQWVSPIVDPDGVLKFTIEKLPDEDVVAVVRVKIRK